MGTLEGYSVLVISTIYRPTVDFGILEILTNIWSKFGQRPSIYPFNDNFLRKELEEQMNWDEQQLVHLLVNIKTFQIKMQRFER